MNFTLIVKTILYWWAFLSRDDVNTGKSCTKGQHLTKYPLRIESFIFFGIVSNYLCYIKSYDEKGMFKDLLLQLLLLIFDGLILISSKAYFIMLIFEWLETANQTAHINCGNCRVLLMYQCGAHSVKCTLCNFVTSVGWDSKVWLVHNSLVW